MPETTLIETSLATHATLYLDPNILTPNEANEKARPSETPEVRKRRVEKMRLSIEAIGQNNPVLVTAVADEASGGVDYEYVDGGSRVEAIAAMNDADGGDRKVWCVLAEDGADLFRQAVRLNFDRVQNSITDVGMIVQETIERNGWAGRGGNKRTAEYLGLSESRVSEYLKVLRAPKDVKERIDSGEITSVDAALALMAIPATERAEIAQRANQIAQEEEASKRSKPEEKPAKKTGAVAADAEPEPEAPAKPTKAKTTKAHIEKAKTEAKGGLGAKWTMAGVREFFEQVTGVAYGKAAVAFAEGVLKRIDGGIADKRLRELFDAVTSPKKVAAVKVKAESKKVAAVIKKGIVAAKKAATNPTKKAAKPAKKKAVKK